MTKLALLANAASSHTQKWAIDLARRGQEQEKPRSFNKRRMGLETSQVRQDGCREKGQS